ncbi:SdrD B-like domain-containing protein, partial [Roseibacillus persicicus]|uniref:SdrD B-like domain-containing protein n=1 Tax=Roseibacillus persicicus TaxID=454148 RepID=UPI00281064E7
MLLAFLACGSEVLAQQQIFFANFEDTAGNNAFGSGNSQWTVNPNVTDTATGGAWERGIPTPTAVQSDTDPTQTYALVTGAYHDPASGGFTSFAFNQNNDVDGGVTSVRSPEIALPANLFSATLTLDYIFAYYQSTSDFFRITLEGASDVVLYEETAPAGGNELAPPYSSLTFDLTPYLGQTVTFLIETADGGTETLVEAGIDNFEVEIVPNSISGEVRFDIDGDGDLANTEAEDRGLAGVTVELFADGGGGVPTGGALVSTVTDADGVYRLLPPANGSYVVVATDLPDSTSTADSGGANDNRIAITFTGLEESGNIFLDTSDAPGLLETVATYYFPFSEADIFNALDTINAAAEDPVTSYNSLSIAYDGTIILYDHWEDNGTEGYEAFRNAPTQVATQVWGDGNLVNGVAPGYPDDLLDAGDVIILQNTFETSDAGSQFYFDGRDKISTSKYVAITRAAWADNTATLLAGAWEMYPTSLWGYEFTLPIGEDLADSVDFQAFEFVGASVMSALDNNEIRLNGTLVATINEGETFTWNGGLNLGDEIVTSRVAQVQLITGDINSNYESRWYTLPPEVQFSNSYVAPVSTRAESATLVWLFNPNSTAIDVDVESSSSATQALNIPANAVISYELTNGDAARFGSTNGETFFALASVDSGDADYTDTNGNTVNENITNDWGFSLVPDVYLTPLVVVGLAPGDDPTYVGAVENSAPIWATAVFPRDSVSYEANRDADPNNDVQITVCVDYNGNGNVDGLSTGGTDPLTGLGYDYQVTIDELDQMIIYVDLDEDGIPDPGADQTGTRIWICDGGTGLLAVAYGQDPDTASVGSPAVDLGTTVPGIPVMALAKDALFENDYNGNGSADIGDQLKYTIVVENSGTGSFPADVVNLLDNLSTHLAYVPGTATLTDSSGTTSVPDNGAGTLFPIDEDNGGFVYEKVLPPGEGFSLVFVAEVVSLPADGTGAIINSVVGQGGTQVIPVTANAPVAFPQGAIGGTVYVDTTGDGNGDTPLDGVEVTLLYSDGSFVDFDPTTPAVEPYTLTTINGGQYYFPNLPAGDYLVSQSQPSEYVTVTDGDTTSPEDDAENSSTTDNLIPVTILENEIDDGNDFVEEVPAPTEGSLSGTVYVDQDNDGIGDVGLSGVVITLKNSAGNDIDSDLSTGGVQPTTTTTATNGSYSFAGLPAGDYQVVESQPSGYVSVSDVDGANNDTIGDETAISVVAGSDAGGNDFIEEQLGSLSGIVFEDLDGNGTGDVAIGGVVLTLKDSAGNDIDSDPVASGVQPTVTTTASNGSYSFSNLRPGDYQVVETQPTGYISVSDADGGNLDLIGDQSLIPVVGGANSSGNNFVEEALPATISGTVLADIDNDNLGEVGIQGVTLTLKDEFGNDIDSDPAAVGVQPTTTTTDSNGEYSFTGLVAGNYQVVESQPSGYDSVSDVDGVNNNVIGDENAIVLTAGSTSSGNDFVEEQTANIRGTVRADTNGNGTLQNNDTIDLPIAGVTVRLFTDPNGDGDPSDGVEVTSLSTNANGDYNFAGISPGTYVVVEDQPEGYFSLLDQDFSNVSDDAADLGVDNSIPVSVTAGENDNRNDFLEVLPGSISGTVLADTDNDDLGDTAIEGVVLTLKDASGNDIDSDPVAAGVQPTVTATDEFGAYSFTGLFPADYRVVETQPSGYDSVSDVDGANNDIIGDETAISVSGGSDSSGNDFVEEAPGSISGTVLADTDNNNTGDTAIEGVVLTLKDAAGNDIDSDPVAAGVQPTTTVTDEFGAYSFTNLTPGDYQVVETQPSGYDSVSDVDGANNDIVGDETPITVSAGSNSSGNDFVEEQPGSLSGTVLADTDNDDAGDTA